MWKAVLAVTGLLLSAGEGSLAAEPLTVLTHELPPHVWQDKGLPDGFAYELVRETMHALGEKYPIEFVSFRRGLMQVQNERGKVLFVCGRSPEREKTVKWVGPLVQSAVYIYQRKGAGLNLNSLDDLREVNGIGVQFGIREDSFLTAQGFTNIFRSDSQALALRALVNKRVDAAPLGVLALPRLLRDEGVSPDAIEQTSLKFFDSDLYIAFSLDVHDETIQRWQKALDKVKREHYERLYAKYLR